MYITNSKSAIPWKCFADGVHPMEDSNPSIPIHEPLTIALRRMDAVQ